MVIWKLVLNFVLQIVNNHNYMENNVQVQKTADISSLVCVVIVSLSALTAYNLGEKFNHYILFDVTIFIISLVMLILTFAVFRKVMAGLYKSINNSAINERVQNNCSQEVKKWMDFPF